MISIRKSTFIKYEENVNFMRMELKIDTASELPSVDHFEGHRLYQGSIAHDISTGEFYAMDSSGTWYKQNRAGGGGSATLIEKTISENGTYNATDDEADGYSKVVVDVPSPTLIDKTITANGEYLPAQDDATAYSKVTVNVDDSAHFSEICCAIPNDSAEATPFYLYMSSNGEYNVNLQASTYEKAFLASPLTKVIYHDTSTIIFTPSDSFDKNTAFKNENNDNYSPIASGSANPTAGDGKIYKAVCNGNGNYSVTITALEFTNSGSTDFNFSIT